MRIRVLNGMVVALLSVGALAQSGGRGGGGVGCVQDLLVNNVTTNSYVVPAGTLQPGHSYIFNITAGSMRDYDPVNQQRFSYPIAFSQVTSAVIMVGGAKAAAAESDSRKSVGNREAVNSPPHPLLIPTGPSGRHGSVVRSAPSWRHSVVMRQPPGVQPPKQVSP